MKIYIAGKISGDPDYKEKFAALEKGIKARWGSSPVINPATLPGGMTKRDYMAICLPMLLRADMVVLLPGWEDSPGATIEKMLAEYVGCAVVTLTQDEYDGIVFVPIEKNGFRIVPINDAHGHPTGEWARILCEAVDCSGKCDECMNAEVDT